VSHIPEGRVNLSLPTLFPVKMKPDKPRKNAVKTMTVLTLLMIAAGVILLSGCNRGHEQRAAASLPTAQVRTHPAELPVVPGNEVREGQLLARIDAAEYKARLEQAQASLQQAEQDWARISGLFKDEAATRAEYETSESRLRSARAAVTEAEVMLGYAEVAAPFAGVVTRKLAEVGDFATPAKGLVELETLGSFRLEADVPEGVIRGIEMGSELNVDAGTGQLLKGKVAEVAPSADPTSRTFLVKVDLPQVPGLRSGQFGRLLLPAGESSALRVPAEALVVRGQLEMLFVVDDAHARMRLVRSGRKVGDEIEILAGLEERDQVVVAGAMNLRDGQPVEVR
jgi:membrane fusion protein, multidrug efflux system